MMPNFRTGYRLALSAALATVGGAACVPAPERPEPRPLRLAHVADSVIHAAPLDRAQWGIAFFDQSSGRMLYEWNAERNFVPASNNKLVISAVALAELGPDYRFETGIHASRRADDGETADHLVVVGRGDPTLSARFHPSDLAALDSLADSVVHAGVRRVDGDLVIDASYFDDQLIHPTWSVGNLPWRYAAAVAAFGIAEGAFQMEVTPGPEIGSPAVLSVLPVPGAVAVTNRLVTAGPDAVSRVYASRNVRTGELMLDGVVPLGAAPDTLALAAPDPALFAGIVFRSALERRGIPVAGAVRVLYHPSGAERFRADVDTPPVATWRSPPLSEVVAAILQPSQNWIAEQLVKTLGAERGDGGTWPHGIEVQRRYLAEIAGLDPTAVFVRDGSGLSHQNLLAPRAVVQLLEHVRQQPWADAYRAALPQPGMDGSTLVDRLLDLEGRLYAKTGTITHVNGLSGYVITRDGRELTFSIFNNATGQPAASARNAIDTIVRAAADGA